jgi:choline dehydrogenase-like flavoprotein
VLQAAGISVKLDHSGVGANFQDHPWSTTAWNLTETYMSSPKLFEWLTDPVQNAAAWEEYRVNKTGPVTNARGNTLAFIPLPEVDPENYRNIASRLLNLTTDAFLPSIYKNSTKLLNGVKAQRKVLADLFQNDEAGIVEYPVTASAQSTLIALQKPASRGSITINPDNPQGPPKIFYNSFSDPIDRSVFGSSLRYIREVWAGPALEKYAPIEISPGAQYTTDEDIFEQSVDLILPSFAHPASSCAMMPEELGGCVSDELLFYGINHLSIVDASIMPLIPSQHLQASMYAIGEKAADIIKNRA